MKELDEKFKFVDDNLDDLKELIYERANELIKIAQENNYTDFGWKESIPEDDDDKYNDFCDARFNFILTDDFAYQTGEVMITRFLVEDNRIYGRESFDDDTNEIIEDQYIRFSYADDYNWKMGYYLLKMMEKELTEAGIAV